MSSASHWQVAPYLLLACIAAFLGWAVLIARRPTSAVACLYVLSASVVTAIQPSCLGLLPQFLFQVCGAIGFWAFCLYAITKPA